MSFEFFVWLAAGSLIGNTFVVPVFFRKRTVRSGFCIGLIAAALSIGAGLMFAR